MRIALVSAFDFPEVSRGGERYLRDLAAYLRSQNHDVTIITGTSGSSRLESTDGFATARRKLVDSRLARAAGLTPFDTFGLRALGPLVRGTFDVVHALVPSGAVAARLTRHPTVLTIMGHPTPAQLRGRRPTVRVYRLGMRAAHVVTAFSAAAALAVERVFDKPAVALPLGVRTDRFFADESPRLGPPRLLFVGSAAERRKGLDVLLRALPSVLDVHPDARLRLLGGGDTQWAFAGIGSDEQRVRAAVDDLGRKVGDIGPVYRDATATILPARDEALGAVLIESLASGTPVVGVTDGGIPEIVSDPRIGRLAEPDDPRSLAQRVLETIELARRPETPKTCAAHARAWDWEQAIGPRHLQLYADLMR